MFQKDLRKLLRNLHLLNNYSNLGENFTLTCPGCCTAVSYPKASCTDDTTMPVLPKVILYGSWYPDGTNASARNLNPPYSMIFKDFKGEKSIASTYIKKNSMKIFFKRGKASRMP